MKNRLKIQETRYVSKGGRGVRVLDGGKRGQGEGGRGGELDNGWEGA